MWGYDFDKDPFFGGHQINRPTGPSPTGGNNALSERSSQRDPHSIIDPSFEMLGFGGMDRMMGRSQGMFGEMNKMMEQMTNGMRMDMGSVGGQDGHSYVQSSVYSYSKNKDGQPDVYEAHHSNRHAPGGMREEKKALRDSKRELEKMAIGRHIGQRGHVMQKQRNTRTNESTQHQNLIGLDEGAVEAYHREWRDKSRNWSNVHQVGGSPDFNNFERRGLHAGDRTPSRHSETSRQSSRAIEYNPDNQKQDRSRKPTHTSRY